jgi:hypothetical protein
LADAKAPNPASASQPAPPKATGTPAKDAHLTHLARAPDAYSDHEEPEQASWQGTEDDTEQNRGVTGAEQAATLRRDPVLRSHDTEDDDHASADAPHHTRSLPYEDAAAAEGHDDSQEGDEGHRAHERPADDHEPGVDHLSGAYGGHRAADKQEGGEDRAAEKHDDGEDHAAENHDDSDSHYPDKHEREDDDSPRGGDADAPHTRHKEAPYHTYSTPGLQDLLRQSDYRSSWGSYGGPREQQQEPYLDEQPYYGKHSYGECAVKLSQPPEALNTPARNQGFPEGGFMKLYQISDGGRQPLSKSC